MTIITLHHLCFGHCVNSSVIVLDLGIFLQELQQSPLISHNDLKKDGAQLLLSNMKSVIELAPVRMYYWICANGLLNQAVKGFLKGTVHLIKNKPVLCLLKMINTFLKNDTCIL